MRIKKFRTIAEVYPYLSLEAMVELDNNEIIYPNISVNDKEQKEEYYEDAAWIYICPLTEVNWENVDDFYADVPLELEREIFKELLDLWNSNPKFENNYEWREYKKC